MKYVSELKELNGKVYDSIKELEAAEAQVNAEIAKKQKAAALRKSDAKKVDDALIAQKEIKKEVAKAKVEAYKTYLATIDELDKKVTEAEEATQKALEEFLKAHPEGYHSTVTFKDGSTGSYLYKRNTNDNVITLSNVFDDVFNLFFGNRF